MRSFGSGITTPAPITWTFRNSSSNASSVKLQSNTVTEANHHLMLLVSMGVPQFGDLAELDTELGTYADETR